jgi:hypothetical protein
VPVGTAAQFMMPLAESSSTRMIDLNFILPAVDIAFANGAGPIGKVIRDTHTVSLMCAFFPTTYQLSGTFRGPIFVTVQFVVGGTVIREFRDLIRVDVA